MKRAFIFILLITIIPIVFAGCSQKDATPPKTFTEQDVKDATTELINGINAGNKEVISKYIWPANIIPDNLINTAKGNLRLVNIGNVSLQDKKAQATATVEIIPLNVSKDITLDFDVKDDKLMVNNPMGLVSDLLQQLKDRGLSF